MSKIYIFRSRICRNIILMGIAFILIVLAVCYLPWPTHVKHVMPAAEVDLDGNVIASGEMSIEGRIRNYAFQTDKFKLTHLQIPNREVGKIYEDFHVLGEVFPAPGNYLTYSLVGLPEYASDAPNGYPCNIFFSEDQSVWIVELTDRIFVGTTEENPDYAQIMEFWGHFIDGFIE